MVSLTTDVQNRNRNRCFWKKRKWC